MLSFLKNKFKSRTPKENGIFYNKIVKIIGFKPSNIKIFEEAFTHGSSKKKDAKGNIISFERLEFLGDAILGSIIGEYLYHEVPGENEGYLTKMRSKVVSRDHLNEIGNDLGLKELIQTKLKQHNFGNNINGNLFEALVGAVYLDSGYEQTQKFIHNVIIKQYVDIKKLEGKVTSYKSIIIEWCQKERKKFKFETYEDTGNDKIKHFSVRLLIDGKIISKGRDTSKKKAEEKAAKRGYYALQKKIGKFKTGK